MVLVNLPCCRLCDSGYAVASVTWADGEAVRLSCDAVFAPLVGVGNQIRNNNHVWLLLRDYE